MFLNDTWITRSHINPATLSLRRLKKVVTNLWVKFNQKFLSFEAEFSDLGPRESFYFGKVLEDIDSTVHHSKSKGYSVLVLVEKEII